MRPQNSDSPAGGEPDGPTSHDEEQRQNQGTAPVSVSPRVRCRVALDLTHDADANLDALRQAHPLRGLDLVVRVGATAPAGLPLGDLLAGVRSVDIEGPDGGIVWRWMRAIERCCGPEVAP